MKEIIKSTLLIVTIVLAFSSCSKSDNQNADEGEESLGDLQDTAESRVVDVELTDDNYAVTVNDIYDNFDSYEGKSIHVTGIAFEKGSSHFVGHYTKGSQIKENDSMLYLEYFAAQEQDYPTLKNGKGSEQWIEVYGTLKRQVENDREFYYIDADQILPAEEGTYTLG